MIRGGPVWSIVVPNVRRTGSMSPLRCRAATLPGCLVARRSNGLRLGGWWLIAIGALSHTWMSFDSCWLKQLDEAPFLPNAHHLSRQQSVRDVIVMHHKRLPELEATLRGLAKLPNARTLTVTVSQSLPSSDWAASNATCSMLEMLAPCLGGMKVRHRPTMLVESNTDGDSYSVNAKLYGNKKNLFRNMLWGLHEVFEPGEPQLQVQDAGAGVRSCHGGRRRSLVRPLGVL